MKVCYVVSDSPIKPCGGLGERIKKLIPRLEALGVEFYIFCIGEGGVLSKTPVHSLDIECPDFGNPYPMMYAHNVLDNLPANFKPDVVVAADWPTFLAAKTLAKIYDAKLVTEFHLAYYSLKKIINEKELEGPLKLHEAAKLISMVEERAIKTSDLVVGCSSVYVNDLPWKAKKTAVIANGIDTKEYEGDFEPYKFEGGFKKNIVFIGRISTQKGVRFLFDYYAQYSKEQNQRLLFRVPDEHRLKLPEDTALHFVGGPVGSDQYDSLLETVKYNPQKFHIPFATGAEKVRILKSADAIVFPSSHEPFGIVGLEAFAAGVPLITTRVDGISDYADDTNSIKCETNAASIRQAIDRLWSMPKEEVDAMLAAARETAKHFNWDIAAQRTYDEFVSLLSS